MKGRLFGGFILFLLLVSATAAQTGVSSSSVAASLVSIASVTSYPQVFYPGEQGTITVVLTNVANQSVGLSQPDIIGSNIQVINANTFQTLTYIGPGSTLSVSFVVVVNGPDGTYFPLFTIGTKDASSIHYPIKVVVDSTDIHGYISNKPDNFAINRPDTVNLSIVNPRDGPINNIIVTASGAGLDISPTESFTSVLAAGSEVDLPFTVTPAQQTNLSFHIAYENGDNKHALDVTLPVVVGEDKTGAKPVVNNIALTQQGNSYQMTGDVSNAGVTDASGMVLTVLPPAGTVEPYPSYAIGTLAAGDFSSFTLTFSAADLSDVPLQVQWKDAEGNTFSTVNRLDLRILAAGTAAGRAETSGGFFGTGGTTAAGSTAGGNAGGGAPRGGGGGIFSFGGGRGGGGLAAFYPVIAGGIVAVVLVGIWVKRKWILSRLRKKR